MTRETLYVLLFDSCVRKGIITPEGYGYLLRNWGYVNYDN
jgi:hypothetical protein